MINPDPRSFDHAGWQRQFRFHFGARDRAIPPGTDRQESAGEFYTDAVKKEICGFRVVKPTCYRFAGGIAAVQIVIA